MANQKHLNMLEQGGYVWNNWRKRHSDDIEVMLPDLSDADLSGIDLSHANLENAYLSRSNLHKANLGGANLSGATMTDAELSGAVFCKADLSHASLTRADLRGIDLSYANLSNADLDEANLSGADLSFTHLEVTKLFRANLSKADLSEANLCGAILLEADLSSANLIGADLTGANLRKANLQKAILSRVKLCRANLQRAVLRGADLEEADLSDANLSEANMITARLIKTNLKKARLNGCAIYGISAWNVQLDEADQRNLVITLPNEPTITIDNLEVAQFIYLLLNNKKIRDVIDTITSKVVLILGRFTKERKPVLDALRYELRKQNYLPVLFDFDKPANRDLTETVSTLAHLARFIIVDLTDPSSAPHEVATIIPHCIVPVQPLLTLQPLIIEGKATERREYAMFQDLRRRHPWVLPTFRYQDTADLLSSLTEHIIEPAEQKAQELAKR